MDGVNIYIRSYKKAQKVNIYKIYYNYKDYMYLRK